ncbi:pseudouridine synthase [Candidatus Hodgkinia cicadicola]|uniref:pseudouridine synthase n=1 Tax=Candidatus Hodgkinia cicadicola TaxID=573658 RepID=UPI0039BF0735
MYEDDNNIILYKRLSTLCLPYFGCVKCLNNSLSYKNYNGISLTMVHRLDYGTCGLMVATKVKDVNLSNQFWFKTMEKMYKLLCFSKSYKTSSCCCFNNTSVLILDKLKLYMVDCKLIVGKRHQIRLQTRCVVGDKMYSYKLYPKVYWDILWSSIEHPVLTSCLISYEITETKRIICVETKPSQISRYILILFLKL